jgi:hypothetical protein
MPIPNAVGPSLFSVGAFGLTTAVNYALSGLVDWALAAEFIAGGIIGGVIGIRLSIRLGARKRALNLAFAGVSLLVAIYMLARSATAVFAVQRRRGGFETRPYSICGRSWASEDAADELLDPRLLLLRRRLRWRNGLLGMGRRHQGDGEIEPGGAAPRGVIRHPAGIDHAGDHGRCDDAELEQLQRLHLAAVEVRPQPADRKQRDDAKGVTGERERFLINIRDVIGDGSMI